MVLDIKEKPKPWDELKFCKATEIEIKKRNRYVWYERNWIFGVKKKVKNYRHKETKMEVIFFKKAIEIKKSECLI